MNFWVSYIFIEQNNNRIWHPFLQVFWGAYMIQVTIFPINRSKKPWADDLQLGHPAKPCEAPKGIKNG